MVQESMSLHLLTLKKGINKELQWKEGFKNKQKRREWMEEERTDSESVLHNVAMNRLRKIEWTRGKYSETTAEYLTNAKGKKLRDMKRN